MNYRRHFFVCTTERPPFAKPSCGLRRSGRLLEAMVEEVSRLGLLSDVGVTGSACLGPCESGPTMVVYPEGVWYRGVQVEDVPEIVQSHARDGKPVARLLFMAPPK